MGCTGAHAVTESTAVTRSPDANLTVTTKWEESGTLTYALEACGRRLIEPSNMGLDSGSAGCLPGAGWSIAGAKTRNVDQLWKPVWGKRSEVPDQFQETQLQLTAPSGAAVDRMTVTIRAYNEGIAFRYEIPSEAKGDPVPAASDLSAFNFAGDYTAWFYNGENPNLGPDLLSQISGTRKPVMTLKVASDAFLAVHEADLRTGQPMTLQKSGRTGFKSNAVAKKIGPGYVGPWRVIFFGSTPGRLLDSHLLELLNPPPQGDFSWVKPGLVFWDWRLNEAKAGDFTYAMSYPTWVRLVDFAAESQIGALMLDANWYGPEKLPTSDPVKGGQAEDVKKLITYAKTKNVDVWLYLNDIGGIKYPLEETLRHYSKWGAVGVKYGFMKGSPEEKNMRTRLITERCAHYRLLVDFHDGPVHPYGQMRSWPNAVTREYCHSQLDAARTFTPTTFLTSIFVNNLAGPLDMCNGVFDLIPAKRHVKTRGYNTDIPSTLAAEAARTLIVFSGATVLPDIPESYRKYPELFAFIQAQRMPWKESRTLSGGIGEHIVMVRQAADGTWLVGAATNEQARELEINLDFLPLGSFDAVIIQDGADAHYLNQRYSTQTVNRTVTASDTVNVRLAPGGGACLMIRPKTKRK